MVYRNITVKIIFLLILHCNLFSQQNLKLLGRSENFAASEINDEIWIATLNKGYNRYRGVDTKHYLLNDKKSGLKGTYISSSLHKDKKGKLWTSTKENLCFFDQSTDKFTCFQAVWEKGILNDEYHILGYDSIGNSLIFLVNDSIFNYDISKNKVTLNYGRTNGNSFYFSQDTIIGTQFIKGTSLELWIRDGKNYKKKICDFSENQILSKRKVFNVLKSENQWWLFTDDGLIKFDFANVMNNKLFKYSQSSKDVMYLGVNFKEFIFITSDHYGVLIFDTKSQKFIRRKPFESLGLHYIFCDRHNRLWLTNIYRDIEIYTIQQFLSNSNDTLNGFTSNQVEIKDDIKVFISQNKGLLIKKDGETRLLELETKKLPIKSIYKAKIIDDNNILLCDLFNIYHYNWTIKKIRKISLPNIRQIEDLNSFRDTLYILSNNTLHRFLWPSLIKINSDIFNKYDYRFDHLCNVTDDMITLCHGDEYVRFSSFSNVSVFIDSYIYNSVYEPYGQEHYLATQNGLFLLIETHNVKSLTDFSPILKDNPVEQIAQSKNFVYFVANNLICRHHKKTERIDIFDQYVFETTPIFGIDSDKLTIAGEQIMEIPLSDAFVSKNKYKLLLDYVLVNNNKTHLENLNDLKHNENSLKWRFYIPDYLHSNVNKIGYRVIPALDTSWIFINNHQEIELSNLAPNKYTIQIKAFFANGQISDIRDYSFTILNPWYKTWYFLLLALTTTIIFGFILSKKYIQSIHQKHAIEKQITDLQRSALQAQMNPHFIFNCLNSIQNYIMRNDKDIAMEYLTKFARLIRQYLNASNTDLVTLDDEISMLTNYLHLEQMRFNQSFEYHFQVDKNLDPTEITLPPLLIQPFVENAILHGMTSITNGGQINIDISKKENQLQITIKDNGKGFDKNKNTGMRRSLGISITQKRLQYINDHAEGNYAISTTSYESGTEINITVKLT